MQISYGKALERRRGLRLRTRCWALLRIREHGNYARAVELSTTGVVLELVGRRRSVEFQPEQRFDLDLFVPGGSAPIHVKVRPVRIVHGLEAFEFVESSAVDRLTLAEHLDHLLVAHRRRAWLPRVRRLRRVTPGSAWKRLLLRSAPEGTWAASAH
jgi:hypothetical protein